jgi:hypothetical protein
VIDASADSCYDIELRMLAAAVSLVATGRAVRVTLAGLHEGTRIVPVARTMAAPEGVVATPLLGPRGCDIRVEACG